MISANSDSSSSSVDDLEIALDDSQQTELLSFSANKSKRAWSPSRPMADSSDEEEPGPSRVGDLKNAAPLAHQTPLKAEPTTLSTFCPVLDRNLYLLSESESAPNEKGAILVLHPNESVTLLGTYTICVLQGYISLLGVTLSPSDTKHRVFAPRSSPLPVLSWVAAGGLPDTCTFPVPPVVRQRSECTAILIRYLDTGVEGLGRICRVFDNVFKPPRNPNVFQNLELPELNLITHSTKDIHPFTLPHSWETALSSIDGTQVSDIATAPICLVRGPKKTGKSTFARTLVNRLLDRYRRVAFLECDLGQSEFTPGGMVALNVVENYVFGPPFTHPSLPYRAHYIGSTSPRSSPSYYLSSIQALVETYRLDVQFTTLIDDPSPGDDRIHDTIPLVVNTMGWTKGLGADLNLRIEEFVEPSHIFEIEGPEERGWPAPLQSQHTPQNPTLVPFTQAKARTHVKLEAISSESTNTYHTAIDHRNLNVLSYFHAIFPELSESSSSSSQLKQITASGWDTSLPLCARYPYEVDCSQAFDQVFLTGPGYEDVVPSELTRVLNGAIVGLVSCDSRISDISTQTPTPWPNGCPFPYTPSQPPPDPASSTCHGLALVRGIPLSSVPPHMHILTPLSPQLLSDARILVKGELELPIWGMLDFRESEEGGVTGVERGHVPYLQWGKGEGVGSEKRRVRRNLMRKGQM
ncbi:hypothetical protein HYDPIDRAFT_97607 [Hydnomerulius pinastri MD-312]|uniref:Polynucleotide 5'-hydroxyl-kinase GRC3 n=1 Tax=Hydnomerulius pinastri MD-312 TaxID=994086 RepID=A0A0C9VSV7_9AGAM|nr:hypothetical protein HYDPIDRAFT_97607 [Hydnomerulius pinastri MD-312]